MKLRFIVSLLALVTVFGLSAKAQELPKIDASVSYSYLRANPATPDLTLSISTEQRFVAYNVRDWVSVLPISAAITL